MSFEKMPKICWFHMAVFFVGKFFLSEYELWIHQLSWRDSRRRILIIRFGEGAGEQLFCIIRRDRGRRNSEVVAQQRFGVEERRRTNYLIAREVGYSSAGRMHFRNSLYLFFFGFSSLLPLAILYVWETGGGIDKFDIVFPRFWFLRRKYSLFSNMQVQARRSRKNISPCCIRRKCYMKLHWVFVKVFFYKKILLHRVPCKNSPSNSVAPPSPLPSPKRPLVPSSFFLPWRRQRWG